MSDVVIELPDALAKEARDAGILDPQYVASMLRKEIRRRRINRLFSAADALSETDQTVTEAEIQAEIDAFRQDRRR